MPYRYAGFISYQRGNDLLDRFARELFQQLSNELALSTPLPVWFDTARLDVADDWGGGNFDALRSTVCLVPILTPTYFSAERPYCAREYLTMEKIERLRNERSGRRESMILPVVLRGTERLPEIVKQRQLFDCTDYLAFGPRQFRSRKFSQAVNEIARRIGHIVSVASEGGSGAADGPLSAADVQASEAETDLWLSSLALPHRHKS